MVSSLSIFLSNYEKVLNGAITLDADILICIEIIPFTILSEAVKVHLVPSNRIH